MSCVWSSPHVPTTFHLPSPAMFHFRLSPFLFPTPLPSPFFHLISVFSSLPVSYPPLHSLLLSRLFPFPAMKGVQWV